MGLSLPDSLLLRGTVARRAGTGIFGMEPHAPAPAKDALVALHQRGERGPRRLVESHHGVREFGHEAQPNGRHYTGPAKRQWINAFADVDENFNTYSYRNLKQQSAYDDHSVELYVGPDKPADAAEANWIRTNPGEGYLCALRLYGPTKPFFDQTWIPDDVVKLT
jgi:Protein of unknown function (DUF1214)